MKGELLGVPLGIGVLLDAVLSGGDFLLMLGTELYTPLAVSASWVAPNVPWLDTQLVTYLATVAAALYVANVLINTYEDYTDETDE